ncbi:site-specific DNA-methyltransferase [Allofournierella massiliensis]|uniref:site-specific DNA-methyltransferase n=1 Tax=Allofournierella massiliensis TaxID=1650663 RepID=UPI00399FC43F
MSERLDRFVSLMKGIFELDKSDLDFGIYRIMNIRKQEIEKFLSEGLPQKVQATLAPFARNTGDIERRLAEIEQSLGADISQLPDSIPMVQEYKQLKSQLAAGVDLSALEADVYSALYSFFNRYYDEGDFISKRRYKEGVYAIPYEGEEVKLYWANQDQYYIKTAENFKDYSFVARNAYGDSCTVHFLLVDATTEQNNNKESKDSKRTFMLYQETEEQPELKTFEYREDTNEFIVRFVFDVPEDKKAKYLELNGAAIRQKIAADYPQLMKILLADVSTDKKKTKTLLDKHLEAYVAKNTFDYFIHKDLKGFLYRELDFYIKSEIIHLDDLDTTNEQRVETYLAKVKAIKRVGHIIIDFLAQIEDFQKKLWLKKKFVVETNWCMTLDRIDEAFWPEIVANPAQMQEWIEMYAIDEVEGDLATVGWTNPPTLDFLRQNQNLVVDTKHFSSDFKDRLVASIEDLDEQTGGLMIRSENYQALNFLAQLYTGKIDVTYIDPPYNTDASEILYKNNYKHSSFLSMMENRLAQCYKLLASNGMVSVAIDDAEIDRMDLLLEALFSKHAGTAVVRSNPQSRKTKGKFSPQHEYCLFYTKTEDTAPFPIGYSISKLKRYPLSDSIGHYAWMNFIRAGNNDLRTDRPKLYYPIAVSKDDELRVLNMVWNAETQQYDLKENIRPDEVLVYPIKIQGGTAIEKNWQRGHERVKSEIPFGEYRVRRSADGISIDFKTRMDEDAMPTTWWDKNEYASANYAPTELKDLFGNKPFDFAKAHSLVKDCICACGAMKDKSIILDFFAGSATTGDVVVGMNRNDSQRRKYILVEMGTYFDTVTQPRIKKVVYSADWKNGKPASRGTGISHIMKYFSLESYEDALSNVQLSEENKSLYDLFGEDYLIHYMLDIESKGSLLNLEQFKTPFNYQMKITERNETKTRRVDLVETFNYLIGLSVARQSTVSYFRSEPDTTGSYEGAVRLVKDNGGEYGFKQLEGTLPDGRRALVIWRTITEDLLSSNAALDAYFTKHRINPQDREFDVIYVNGDNNLDNLRTGEESWKVQMTELEFKARMFEEE